MQTQHEQEPAATPLQQVQEVPAQEQAQMKTTHTIANPKSKRIVSKSDYLANIGKKGLVAVTGVVLFLISLVCVGVVCLIASVFADVGKYVGIQFMLYAFLLAILLSCGMVYVFRIGKRAMKKARQLESGVPLTRANAADLPAPDSLVRASAEPLQAQEGVLLRAAAQGQKTPSEQLVRASVKMD